MARDKAKDDNMFSCSQPWEGNLVANHYGTNKDKVLTFLEECCKNNTIKNSTHLEVYGLIEKKFGYPIPD